VEQSAMDVLGTIDFIVIACQSKRYVMITPYICSCEQKKIM
jgi:hypothetical protein